MSAGTIKNLETVISVNVEGFGKIDFDVNINQLSSSDVCLHSVRLVSNKYNFTYYKEYFLVVDNDDKYINAIKETVAEMLLSDDFNAYKKLSEWDFKINERDVRDKNEIDTIMAKYNWDKSSEVSRDSDIERIINENVKRCLEKLKPFGFIE